MSGGRVCSDVTADASAPRRPGILPTLLTLTALSLLACKDDPDDTGPDDTGTGDGGTGDGGTETDVLGFFIWDPGTAAMDPVPGVTVAFDTTDGERLEAETGADGVAAVELDIERFAAAIAHADGHSFAAITAAAVVPSYEPGTVLAGLPVWPLTTATALPVSAGTATVSGALLNKVDDAHNVLVAAPNTYQDFNGLAAPTAYSLAVPTGQVFALVAVEWEDDPNWGDDRIIEETMHAWAVVEHPAISGPTTIDIDFAAAVVPEVVSGSIVAPDDAVLAGQGYLYISVYAGLGYCGFSPSTSPGADGQSYDFVIEHVDVMGIQPTAFVAINAPDGSQSGLEMGAGIPSSGAQDLGMMSPPRRSDPEGEGPFPWDQPISWSPSPDGETVLLYHSEPEQVGVAFLGPDEVEFALPALPSTSTTFVAGDVWGYLFAGANEDADPQFDRWGADAPFYLDSPFAD